MTSTSVLIFLTILFATISAIYYRRDNQAGAMCAAAMTGAMATYGYLTEPIRYAALAQASVCAGICIMIAFKYSRGRSKYRLLPSLCAFGLASTTAQQWLSISGRILVYGEWPEVSIYNTMILAIILVLVCRANGNVAKIATWDDWDGHTERRRH
ncbi:phage holin family protein [Pseudomonas luteola]|uniref:phage holin family protein n=1 Tax=Pseudomonas luteola TaxID=47886 RepID=UPI003A83C37F